MQELLDLFHRKQRQLEKQVFLCCFISTVATPYNVGSVLRRLFSTAEAIQYCGGIASVLRGDSISTVEG